MGGSNLVSLLNSLPSIQSQAALAGQASSNSVLARLLNGLGSGGKSGDLTGAASTTSAPASATLPCADTTETAADTFGASSALQDQFDSIVYQSQMQRMSLSVQMQQVAARVSTATQGEDGQASVEAEAQAVQLQFDFFAESRTEELTTFQQRMDKVAEGLDSTQQAGFTQTTQQLSMRFSMSMTISGAALNGAAKGAEGLQDSGESFDKFMSMIQDTLDKADEIVNQVLEFMDDFFSGGGDIESKFNKLLDSLGGIDILKAYEGNSATNAAGQNGSGQSGAGKGVQFQAFGMQIQMEFQFQYQSVSTQQGVQQGDPLMLDLDNDGEELTSYTNGAQFDLTGSGQKVNTAFVTGGDAFLAMDSSGNGAIDSGHELFGEQNGATNGFEELRKLDSNSDGKINASDKDFAALRLWKDNGNGKTEAGELLTLAQAGVSEIGLNYSNVNEAAAGGNRIAQSAYFVRADGSRGRATDALLNYTA